MKRLLKISVLFVFMIIFCTACEGDVTRALRHDGFAVGNDIDCEVFFGKNAEKKVRYYMDNRIIATDGSIYELSLSQKFSNNSSCMIASTNIVVVALLDNNIVKASDGNFYYLLGGNNEGAYAQVPATDNSYAIYELLLKPEGTIKVITANSSTGTYYVLKSDGNVYEITISRPDYNSPFSVVGSSIIYNNTEFGGPITDFNYAGVNSGATFVRTASKVFRMKPSNTEECTKYVDVACTYSMEEVPLFEEYHEYIAAYNGRTVVTTYKKMFTINS